MQYLIFSAYQRITRHRVTNAETIKVIIQYIDTKSRYAEKDQIGFIPIDRDLGSDFSLLDFKDLPAVYDIQTYLVPGYKGKPQSRVKSINFVKHVPLFVISPESLDAKILLGAQFWDFTTTERVQLSKLFVLDPSFVDDEVYKGLPVVAYNYFNKPISDLKPMSYYTLDTRDVRGRGGKDDVEVVSLTYLSSLEKREEVA